MSAPLVPLVVYVIVGTIALLVLVGLSFCTLICVLRICQKRGMIDISENRRIPVSVRRMISRSGNYNECHDYEDTEAQWAHTPQELFEGSFLQSGDPSNPSSGLYSELPFFSDDNMPEFFQDQIYNLSTRSGDSTYFPNPFPHVTGSQQNLSSPQASLPLSGSEMYSRLYPPSHNWQQPTRGRSISQSSNHSDHSQLSNRTNLSRLSNQSRHSNHSQLSNHSRQSNHSQHSSRSHRSNRSAVAEPQIPLVAPFPMNPSDQPPPSPSHPPLQEWTSTPDEILLTVVSCLMHRRNCQIPNCPCKSVQERYRELHRQHPSYHPHQHAAETCKRECGPNADPGGRKHQLHLTLSSQNLTRDTHPHYHLTTKSHIRHVMPKPPLKRQRSRSCDLTPSRESPPEFSPVAVAPADGAEVDGFYSDPDYKPPYLREISISADNIPALCLNDCPLTPTPLREFRTLISSPMRSRKRWSIPKTPLKSVQEKQASTETSETDNSNTSSRSGSHEHLATGSDSELHSERTGQKRIYGPTPPNPNGWKEVTSLGESGYDSTAENIPPIPRWYNKVTSMGESGYDSTNFSTSSSHEHLATGLVDLTPSCPKNITHHDKHLERTTTSPHLHELEAVDYIDPPNSNVHFMDDIEVLQCTSSGGRYHNSVHDIQVEVPKGAVPQGMTVKLEVGVALFGAFLFPVGMKAISPILWLCAQSKQFTFRLPIEVKLPHCLQLTSFADITSLQLGFMKGGHNSDGKGNIPFRYSGQATFQPHSSYCTIRINHFCYLCLTANCTSPQFCSKTLFCLIRVVPRPIYSCTWDINFCVAMFLNTCIEVSSL